MMQRLLLLLAVAACNTPPLTLKLRIADGPAQTCPDTRCSAITMSCDPWVSIRILDPHQPTAPFVSVCKAVTLDRNQDLCSLASVELPSGMSVPEITLEVQVVIYPRSQLATDPMTGDVVCPTDIQFDDATGAPVEGIVAPGMPTGQPAIGGRAYYHAGDSQTVVPLGCTDLTLINDPSCTGNQLTTVNATIDDFDTRLSVTQTIADQLTVSTGEPQPMVVGTDTIYQLNPANVRLLDKTPSSSPPAWTADVDLMFVGSACIEVLEDGAQTTATLSCIETQSDRPPDMPIEIVGQRLSKASLDEMLGAIGKTQFPSKGLVVGIVLDDVGNPVPPGFTVSASMGHVEYLSATRTGLITGGTSTNGIFLSEDAPYDTKFTSMAGTGNVVERIGGLVENKVTIVVLQFSHPLGT